MRSIPSLALAAMALAGCTPKAPPKPAPATPPLLPAGEETCVAQRLGIFIGKPTSSEVLARIRGVVGERPIRTIRPGDAVTMDYAPERLNIELGADGAIKRFRCG